MQIDLACQPSYTMAYIRLDAGEGIICESDAMVAMSAGIETAASTGGGVASALLRKVAGQETFFMGKYRAVTHGAWVAVAPRFPGDINVVNMAPGRDLILQTGSLLAHGERVETTIRFGGVGTIIQREGLAVLLATGEGSLVVCSYGGLQRFDLGIGERVVVDTGHLVAWSAGMGLKLGPLSGVVSAGLTGEGVVAELTGPGEVFIQTRAEASLRSWIAPSRSQNRS
jgi:uncharacterized protein (TIGR00266 family)